MIDPTDIRFCQTLRQVCDQVDGVDPACRDLVDRAIEMRNPDHLRAARQSLDALDADVKDRLLLRVHARMATDVTGLIEALRGPFGPGRLH